MSDDSVGHIEAMCFLFDEFSRSVRRDLGVMSDFNSLGDFIYGDEDLFVTTKSSFKWSLWGETPHGEGPGWWNCAQDLGGQVLLFGKELASFEPLNEVFGVTHGRGPVETNLVGLAD